MLVWVSCVGIVPQYPILLLVPVTEVLTPEHVRKWADGRFLVRKFAGFLHAKCPEKCFEKCMLARKCTLVEIGQLSHILWLLGCKGAAAELEEVGSLHIAGFRSKKRRFLYEKVCKKCIIRRKCVYFWLSMNKSGSIHIVPNWVVRFKTACRWAAYGFLFGH